MSENELLMLRLFIVNWFQTLQSTCILVPFLVSEKIGTTEKKKFDPV